MTPITPARMIVVKKENKEPLLRQFLADGLTAARTVGVTPRLRVLALSLASPVVRMLTALGPDLADAGVVVEMILGKVEASPLPSVGAHVVWRHLADVRCHDAHELLVLGTNTAWIGDCLRRDPATRDSFELHAAQDALTARLANQSFDRLWSIAVPFQTRDDDTAQLTAHLAALPSEPAPQVLTRH